MILGFVDRRGLTAEVEDHAGPAAQRLWSRLAAAVGPSEWRVDVVLVEDGAMTVLNGRYRGAAEVTDVLSFSYLEESGTGRPDLAAGRQDARRDLWRSGPVAGVEEPVGEVLVAPEFVARRCRERGWSVEHEMALLVVHGLLHVLGWEHAEEADRADMRAREAEILGRCGLPHPLREGE